MEVTKASFGTIAILLVGFSFLVSCTSGISWTSGQVYRSLKGVDISGVDVTTKPNVNSLGVCFNDCYYQTHNCNSFAYDRVNKTCKLSGHVPWDPQISITENVYSSYVILQKDPTWTLVFRATKGIGKLVWDKWNEIGYHDDDLWSPDIPPGCYSLDGRLSCDRHFRSKVLDTWQGIKEAKFAFYTDGVEVMYVTFNATGSVNRDEVFAMDRIIGSSITQLVNYSGAYNFDSTEGFDTCQRKFYLNRNFNNCGDEGWMYVSDGPMFSDDCCSFEMFPSYPQFMYTKTDSYVLLNGQDFGRADVFAVHVKT